MYLSLVMALLQELHIFRIWPEPSTFQRQSRQAAQLGRGPAQFA